MKVLQTEQNILKGRRKSLYKMNIISIIISIFLLSCTNRGGKSNTIENSQLIAIDIGNNLNEEVQNIYLSDAVFSLDIIPLEFTDKSAIKDIYYIGITEKDIVVTFYRQLLHFSRDGKFLNEIGRFGNGPEEYCNTLFCMIRGNHEEVYVFTGQGIKVYDYDGSFKREASKLTTEEMFSGMHPKLVYFSDYLFLLDKLPLISPKDDFWSLALVDTIFNIQKKFYNPAYEDRYSDILKEENRQTGGYAKNHWSNQFLNEEYYNNIFKIKHDAVDTIYQFNEDKLEFDPVYFLSLGERPTFEMSHSWIKEPAFFKYLWIYDFYESADYIYFLAGKNEMVYTIQYNKKNKEIKIKKDKSFIRESELPSGKSSTITHRRLIREFKLTNDISGGLDFVVDHKTPEGYWVSIYQPSELLEKINIEELKKAEVKDKEAKSRLIDVLTNLSEDDNPVLFIAKLK